MRFLISSRFNLFRCTSLVALFSLGACVGSAIPVVDRNNVEYRPGGDPVSGANTSRVRLGMPASGLHSVKRGDTLYSIAFAYGLDIKRLASANGIDAPYTIRPGQKISLLTVNAVDKKLAAKPEVLVRQAGAKTNSASTSSSSAAKKKKRTPATKPSATAGNTSWRWPVNGKLLSGYGENPGKGSANKGIDIAGKNGEAVRAARAGTVVYSGNGIQGYGNLVIVRHSSEYLSAYAYNRLLVVSEGDKVKEGQKIAELGNSGSARQDKLHFEIRKSGKPVNPLKLLPKRG